jgi:hypothetical protein
LIISPLMQGLVVRFIEFPFEWVVIPAALLIIAGGLWMTARPGRLTLSPDGLGYRLAFSNHHLAWAAIRGVAARTRNGKPAALTLALASNEPLVLAGGWPMERMALAQLIEDARRQWSPPGTYETPVNTPRPARVAPDIVS